MRWSQVILLATCLLAASPGAAQGPDGGTPPCALPASTTGLVLGVQRIFLPMKQPSREERSEVTFDGTCTARIDCVRISQAQMQTLIPLVHATRHPLVSTQQVSPHYGRRMITARWPGGQCTIVDAPRHLIEAQDRPRFYAAFDAIGAMVVANRPRHRPR
jgi:hypothetical protein